MQSYVKEPACFRNPKDPSQSAFTFLKLNLNLFINPVGI